jgi:hypothetical protein
MDGCMHACIYAPSPHGPRLLITSHDTSDRIGSDQITSNKDTEGKKYARGQDGNVRGKISARGEDE